jgi:polyphosphate kinase
MPLAVRSIWQWFLHHVHCHVVRLPDELTEGKEHHVMLSSIIHTHVSDLFPGMTATGCYQFRVTRNADLTLNEDVEDLAEALKDELSSRRFGRAVRLEVNKNCPNIFMNTYSKNSIWIRINCIVSTGLLIWLDWSRILNAHIYAMSHILL